MGSEFIPTTHKKGHEDVRAYKVELTKRSLEKHPLYK